MPSREQLHKYQDRMINFIYTTPKCALWAGLGLGATISTLDTAILSIRSTMAVSVVIVLPSPNPAHNAHFGVV